MPHEGRTAIIAGLAANVAIAVTKLLAAAHTGSSAMMAEGFHSLVDCADSGLLWYGLHRSTQPADDAHPLGHGKEIYFWAFVIALLFFALGAGMSFYEGVRKILAPEPPTDVKWAFIVLGASLLFTLGSFAVAIRGFRARRAGRSYWRTFRQSIDPTFFTLVLEDVADLSGILLAATGIALSEWLRAPVLDGVASVAVGGVMATVAILLARESKSLLIGESARPRVIRAIADAAHQQRTILRVQRPVTMVLGPDSILVAMDVQFRAGLSTAEVASAIELLERTIQRDEPSVRHIYIEARSVKEAVENRS